MKCVLCGKTSIQVKIDQFRLSPEARKMLQKQFGIDPDAALASHGVCHECLALPVGERKGWPRRLSRTNRMNIDVN